MTFMNFSGIHQTEDLGENLLHDLRIVNRELLDDVSAFSSAERRVLATTEVFMKAFLEQPEIDQSVIRVTRGMLDDGTGAAKECMDSVKVKLHQMLQSHQLLASVSYEELSTQIGDPSDFVNSVISLLRLFQVLIGLIDDIAGSRRQIMERKFNSIDFTAFPPSWCCGENHLLFRERWDRLFREFCDVRRICWLCIAHTHCRLTAQPSILAKCLSSMTLSSTTRKPRFKMV